MRKLNTSDVFAFTRMVKEIGLKEEIKGIASKATEEEDVNKVGCFRLTIRNVNYIVKVTLLHF